MEGFDLEEFVFNVLEACVIGVAGLFIYSLFL